MTDTLTTGTATAGPADPGCGCCKPPVPATVEDEVRELQARRDAVVRELAMLEVRP
jgi:hypothetical protein